MSPSEANQREKDYPQGGMYLMGFGGSRVNASYVVDATRVGNAARFINFPSDGETANLTLKAFSAIAEKGNTAPDRVPPSLRDSM